MSIEELWSELHDVFKVDCILAGDVSLDDLTIIAALCIKRNIIKKENIDAILTSQLTKASEIIDHIDIFKK